MIRHVAVIIKINNILIKMVRQRGSYNHLLLSEDNNFGNIKNALANYLDNLNDMGGSCFMSPPEDISPICSISNNLYPVDYGLVFIDYDSKEIHNFQSYNIPGAFNLIEFNYDLNSKLKSSQEKLISHHLVNIIVNEKEFSLSDFFRTKNSKVILKKIRHMAQPIAFKKKNKLWNAFKALFFKPSEPMTLSVYFKLKSWNLFSYEDNASGCMSLFNKMIIYLNNEDILEWQKYVKKYDTFK